MLQALLAMGSQVSDCSAAMEAMRVDVRKGTYHNPMAISQTLPALQQRSYLHVKTAECRGEDGERAGAGHTLTTFHIVSSSRSVCVWSA